MQEERTFAPSTICDMCNNNCLFLKLENIDRICSVLGCNPWDFIALERAGISIERYVAYEIYKYAIQISQKNYHQIEHCKNVFDGDFIQYQGFDLLIGGSPCTYWSIAKTHRETTSDGEGFRLFMQYVRALQESKCKYFLYENNYSIHKNIKKRNNKKVKR